MRPDQITIITPSLHSADVIGDCVRSVARQEPVAEHEHLVVDGESEDGTLVVLKSQGFNGKLITEPPRGIYSAINTGIKGSSGAIVGILHADDFYATKTVLASVRDAFDDPAVDACFGDLCYVDNAKPSRIVRYWRAGEFSRKKILNGWMPPHPTLFVRRKCYEQFGLYRTDLGTAADYEMILRLLVKHEINAVYIPEVLVHMRTGGASNSSWRARIQANRMDSKAWKVNGLRPYPWTTIAKPLRKIGQWISRP